MDEMNSAGYAAMRDIIGAPRTITEYHIVHDTGSTFDVVRTRGPQRFRVSSHPTRGAAVAAARELPNYIED